VIATTSSSFSVRPERLVTPSLYVLSRGRDTVVDVDPEGGGALIADAGVDDGAVLRDKSIFPVL
jgi:hypothetical protein